MISAPYGRRINTQFKPVIFPPGEVQPTTRTHFEVRLSIAAVTHACSWETSPQS